MKTGGLKHTGIRKNIWRFA